MTIPFLSLTEQTEKLKAEVLVELARVIDCQGFANGPAVAQFEKDFAQFLGVKHVVCMNSGTTALHAALLGAGVAPGDEVVTVSHTWISTVWAVSYVGAKPVFCEVDPRTCGMDPSDLAKRITPRTRAIVPVHLYGCPVEMQPILELAHQKGIPVIEDAAQSIGAEYQGRQTGTFGLVNATSFYPGKNLGAYGEGGAAMTDDDAIANRLRCLRDHAQAGRHNHVEVGYNWRMDGFQGAVLSVKLRYLKAWNERRREIAARYYDAFRGLSGLRLLTPPTASNPTWHIFPVFHAKRDAFRAALERKGVLSGVHYPKPVHLQPAYAHLGYSIGALPLAEQVASEEISLPMFPELTDTDAARVIEVVREVCAELA